MNNGMTKTLSSALHGFAILLMLYHHLFCVPGRLPMEYYHVLGSAEIRIAWFCKICVAIYAFVSGYGMCASFDRSCPIADSGTVLWFVKAYRQIIFRVLGFLKKYWIVFAVFVPIGYLMGYYHEVSIPSFLLNLVGYKHIYNTEWWYVRQYIFMLVVFPFLYYLLGRVVVSDSFAVKMISVGFMLALGILFVSIHVSNSGLIYTTIFAEGMICFRSKLFEIGKNCYLNQRSSALGVSVLLLLLCFFVRNAAAESAGYSVIDTLITPFLVFAFCFLFANEHTVCSAMEKLGKHSTYMWLVHSFYCYYFFQPIMTVVRISSVMYIELLALSIITSMVLFGIEHAVNRFIKRGEERWDQFKFQHAK